MIIKASQRSGARSLAAHLLNDENEHVTVHELKGFSSDDVMGAFQEMTAIAKGTQCKKHLFSVSLNPPANQVASDKDFEQAISKIEAGLNLIDQPRCVIFHEKEGRKHCHCVWSRIDGENMKAIKLPYFKTKLNGIAKELYLEHDWELPQGFQSPALSDPRNFTLEEWQQAKRHDFDPREIKQRLQRCWKGSEDKDGFQKALTKSGFFLAKGDRRGYVTLDWNGEVYSLTRSLKVKSKALQEKLGERDKLPPVSAIKAKITLAQTELHKRLERELALKHKVTLQPIQKRRTELVKAHRQARQDQTHRHEERWQQEHTQRQEKIRKGLGGLWDFLTGRSHKQKRKNELDTEACQQRDHKEREQLIRSQLTERRQLQEKLTVLRKQQRQERMNLNAEFVSHAQTGIEKGELRQAFKQAQDQPDHAHTIHPSPKLEQ
ncbi:relaxase/mobilization nuclease domain-containing protein [Marinomonas mediterranea]|uniref:relaxase/mobilization nuclease domain-containing protein n=1 Tax=Marinomonas mediterranea TaxID=119864 RepID=UPI00234922FB|nr:hypothetical protein [Marinomonas mediterranea]WCN09994.1 relaxase [Marinomonas mediterranea]